MLTVSKAISKMSDNFLVDYMFNFEVRYANIVLRTMKYLSPKLSQPFLIYELDFELTSFFRYLRWKMFKIYSKHATELQRSIQRMFGILSLGVSSLFRMDFVDIMIYTSSLRLLIILEFMHQ